MRIVQRNTYLQLGHHSYDQWYPPRIFLRHFNQRWSHPNNNCNLKFKKPNVVDMIIKHRNQRVKPIFRGMLHIRRGQQYVMGPYSRKDMDFHRIR